MKEVGIQHFQIGMPGNKEPFVNSESWSFIYIICVLQYSNTIGSIVPKEGVARALNVVLDRRNHPVLIHCNKGKVCRSNFDPIASEKTT